ncbi:FkbM family methyltransferase [Flammeovirgaceae bacterium SG7u.111]|nr:FkbM family methyltransferase [Flammeovirgaceae bacterium SG7u.132]WPO36428.1 FkbM family methyltransferase [Flammeovirgaceae bacterium SG7u.111]
MIVRKLLFTLLGFKNYLKFISYIFLKSYVSKFYLGEHFQVRFLEKLVKPGSVCIDIGANLGYFTIPLSRITGKEGKVFAVEPVKDFRETLESNIASFALGNVEVLPYALGETDNLKVQMGTPRVDGVVRHGRTEVLESGQGDAALTHEATMMSPKTLFADLKQLDYIKCDVEGYELHIIPHFVYLCKKFKPVLEIEIDSLENKREMIQLLGGIGYSIYYLENEKLKPFKLAESKFMNVIELYFLPDVKLEEFKHLL